MTQELREAAACNSIERQKLQVIHCVNNMNNSDSFPFSNLHLISVQVAQDYVREERCIKEALQQQVATLNQVNDALEKRCDTLVRRMKLNSSFAKEVPDLVLLFICLQNKIKLI